MFDIGGLELLVIAVVALIVIGPKDLPVAIRTVRQWMTRARDLAREFQGGLDEIARDAKIDEVRREIDKATRVDSIADDFKSEIENTIDPGGKVAESLKLDRDWFSPDAPDLDGKADGDRSGDAKIAEPAAVLPPAQLDAPPDEPPAPVEPVATRREG
jgi:sec-independent protein translocase protein TatB